MKYLTTDNKLLQNILISKFRIFYHYLQIEIILFYEITLADRFIEYY